MTENADLLTNAATALDRYRAEERAIELELSIMQTRLELTREFIGALTAGPRTRRQRLTKETTIIEMPTRTDGGLAEPETAA